MYPCIYWHVYPYICSVLGTSENVKATEPPYALSALNHISIIPLPLRAFLIENQLFLHFF